MWISGVNFVVATVFKGSFSYQIYFLAYVGLVFAAVVGYTQSRMSSMTWNFLSVSLELQFHSYGDLVQKHSNEVPQHDFKNVREAYLTLRYHLYHEFQTRVRGLVLYSLLTSRVGTWKKRKGLKRREIVRRRHCIISQGSKLTLSNCIILYH